MIHGVKYHKGAAVVHQHSLIPFFLMIEDIFIKSNGDIIFSCRKMHSLRFHKHLHSYEVALMNLIVTTKYDDLLDYHPLDIYSIRINEIIRKFVRMRYDLADSEQ